MNMLKRFFGLVCMLIAPASLWFLVSTALAEISLKPVIDTKIQWGVFCAVFIPISIGFFLFGWYAMQGEYNRLPKSSGELDVD